MKRPQKKPATTGTDIFPILLVSAVVLAYLCPAAGSGKGTFSLSGLANCGISVIFFFYGLRLNSEKLRASFGNRRLHLLVHGSTFVLFPALAWLLRPLFDYENMPLWLGVFYLSALPSTVSSSVVMVSIAKGNIPAAVFNASISSLAGVFITPLWMSAALPNVSGGGFSQLGSIILKLIVQVLLPVALGMLLNRKCGSFAEKHKRTLGMFDQTVILLIVYTSFCTSFDHHVFDEFSTFSLVACASGMMVLFFTVYGIITFASRRLKLSREDTITAQFCGSKKSLVHGTAMSQVIFTGYSGTGVVLLPIMLYHALQLMIISAIASRKAMDTTDS
ncbi:MAG: bile acid:sodium symporter [Bacteroidales bacterium]|jgi:sodium/bile acid cotransporter 7|nr:bile acid:sodium symporter [Bacteroidales bacterium]